MVTREQTEVILLQAAEHQQHGEPARVKIRELAAAKHQREAADFREFAAVDQAAYQERIAASVTRAVADLEAAKSAEAGTEDRAAEALRVERALQDRVREAREHARQQQEAWKHVKGRSTPAHQQDALVAAEAAERIAQGEQAEAEGATTAREVADAELRAARLRVTAADDALRAARELAASPGRALYSPETLRDNIPHALRIWDTLTPLEQQHVKQAIQGLAMLTGLYDEIKARGAAEREAELERKRPRPAPFNLPVGSAAW